MGYALSLNALGAILVVSIIAWFVSIRTKNVAFVDSLWSLFFLLAAVVYAVGAHGLGARGVLVLVLTTIWAARLSVHITIRNWGEAEDSRYQQIRGNNEPFWIRSLYLVFGLQGVLAWIISMPLLVAITQLTQGSAQLGLIDAFAVVLWVIGFVFETGGDYQLAKFKSDPANKGKVLSRGLWRYTRHPNYFGDSCVWWSFYLFAVPTGGWWTIFAPLLVTLLLLKVSGVAMLEKTIGDRRPDYADYVARTNAFFPGPPSAPGQEKELTS